MNTLANNHDTLENLIYNEDWKIQAIDLHPDMDLMLIILNTGSVLKERISKYFLLTDVTKAELMNYQFIGGGTGVHWPELDEDLSLKGFLRDAIREHVAGVRVA